MSRFKSRLVAAAWRKDPNPDYTLSYVPVLRYVSKRCILATAAHKRWKCYCYDIKNAYVLAPLKPGQVFVLEQAPGMTKRGPNGEDMVLFLKKGLYGLVPSGRNFSDYLNARLVAKNGLNLTRSKIDASVYYNDSMTIGAYVDDLVVAVKDEETLQWFNKEMEKAFPNKVKYEGKLSWCLGMKITQDTSKGLLTISQEKFIEDCLDSFGWKDIAGVYKPSVSGIDISVASPPISDEEIKHMKKVPYRSAVGKLLYISTGTRPDIAFVVSQVARHSSNPSRVHWGAIKRIFAYLKHTKHVCITYRADAKTPLYAYVDADWAGCKLTRRSTTGFVIMFANAAVCWGSRKQQVIALSSCESEYIAGCICGQEVMWIRSLFMELGFKFVAPVRIWCDNQSAIAMMKNPGSKRAKHIDIRYHWIRMQVMENKIFEFMYCSTHDNLADLLTKNLCEDRTVLFRNGVVGKAMSAKILKYKELKF